MKKESQEAMDWLKPVKNWESGLREEASHRFFQVWNSGSDTAKGVKASATISANNPLRCTVWRSSVRKFDEILSDLILRDKEGLIDTFIRGLEEVYPQLEAQAKTNPQLQEQLLQVDVLLGKGRYENQGLKTQLLNKHEEEIQRATSKGKKDSPAEGVIISFYGALEAFPVLQKKYLEAVLDLKYIDVENVLKKGTGGHYTGSTITSQGVKRPARLLTFYLMNDLPYFASLPKESMAELMKKFPEGNQPENALEGVRDPKEKKTSDPWSKYPMPNKGEARIYVQNEKNPNYDFVTFKPGEILKKDEVKRKAQQKVIELQRQSLFGNVSLASNVLQNSPGFEDKKGMPGISLLHLGQESMGFDIDENERDLTKLDKGGLFWVPEKGLPLRETSISPVKSKEEKDDKYVFPEKEARMSPSRNLFSHSIEVVLAQIAEMKDLWFDEEGKEYDSMEQIEAKYQQDIINEGMSHLEEDLKSILESILSQGARVAPILKTPEIETEPVEEETEEELADIIKMPQEEEEKEFSLAAKQVIRLVRIANLLDNKGFSQEADLIDNIVRDIISK